MAVNTAVEKPHPLGVFVLISLLFYHMYMAHNSFILFLSTDPTVLVKKKKRKDGKENGQRKITVDVRINVAFTELLLPHHPLMRSTHPKNAALGLNQINKGKNTLMVCNFNSRVDILKFLMWLDMLTSCLSPPPGLHTLNSLLLPLETITVFFFFFSGCYSFFSFV